MRCVLIEGVKKKCKSTQGTLPLDLDMPNFETMRSLQWKLDQAHTKASPKTFLHHLNSNTPPSSSLKTTSTTTNRQSKGVWTQDIVLYTLLLVVVVVFVYIVMSYAKEFGT